MNSQGFPPHNFQSHSGAPPQHSTQTQTPTPGGNAFLTNIAPNMNSPAQQAYQVRQTPHSIVGPRHPHSQAAYPPMQSNATNTAIINSSKSTPPMKSTNMPNAPQGSVSNLASSGKLTVARAATHAVQRVNMRGSACAPTGPFHDNRQHQQAIQHQCQQQHPLPQGHGWNMPPSGYFPQPNASGSDQQFSQEQNVQLFPNTPGYSQQQQQHHSWSHCQDQSYYPQSNAIPSHNTSNPQLTNIGGGAPSYRLQVPCSTPNNPDTSACSQNQGSAVFDSPASKKKKSVLDSSESTNQTYNPEACSGKAAVDFSPQANEIRGGKIQVTSVIPATFTDRQLPQQFNSAAAAMTATPAQSQPRLPLFESSMDSSSAQSSSSDSSTVPTNNLDCNTSAVPSRKRKSGDDNNSSANKEQRTEHQRVKLPNPSAPNTNSAPAPSSSSSMLVPVIETANASCMSVPHCTSGWANWPPISHGFMNLIHEELSSQKELFQSMVGDKFLQEYCAKMKMELNNIYEHIQASFEFLAHLTKDVLDRAFQDKMKYVITKGNELAIAERNGSITMRNNATRNNAEEPSGNNCKDKSLVKKTVPAPVQVVREETDVAAAATLIQFAAHQQHEAPSNRGAQPSPPTNVPNNGQSDGMIIVQATAPSLPMLTPRQHTDISTQPANSSVCSAASTSSFTSNLSSDSAPSTAVSLPVFTSSTSGDGSSIANGNSSANDNRSSNGVNYDDISYVSDSLDSGME